MTLRQVPYPHIMDLSQDHSLADALLQQYHLVRETHAFEVLSGRKSSPKTLIMATQAVDNIMYIGINCCDNVSAEQVDAACNDINWAHPDFDTVNTNVLPIILTMMLMGIMKVAVSSKQLIYWNEYVKKYSHALANR